MLPFKEVAQPSSAKIEFIVEGTDTKRIVSITVLPEPTIRALSFAEKNITLGKELEYTLKPTFVCSPEKIGTEPAEKFLRTIVKKITYTSSDDTIASVSSEGVVYTKAEGQASITATSQADPTKTATVTVKAAITSFSLSTVPAIYYGSPDAKVYFSTTNDVHRKFVITESSSGSTYSSYLKETTYDYYLDLDPSYYAQAKAHTQGAAKTLLLSRHYRPSI